MEAIFNPPKNIAFSHKMLKKYLSMYLKKAHGMISMDT